MIAVAVVGMAMALMLELSNRRSRFMRIAREYQALTELLIGVDQQSTKKAALAQWQSIVAEKYRRAARYPWLPLEPDPPPPE